MKPSYTAMTRICDGDPYGRAYLDAVMRAQLSFRPGCNSSNKIPVTVAGEETSLVWLTKAGPVADADSVSVEAYHVHVSGPLMDRVKELQTRANKLSRLESRLSCAGSLALVVVLALCLSVFFFSPAPRSHSVSPNRELPKLTQ
jgi:hypothetical protein